MKVIARVTPMGAPRMTQRDKWKKRPVVVRYRAFKDALRESVPDVPEDAAGVSWVAYMPFPKSYSKKKRAELAGQAHRQKPDRDNIDKAILDTLFKEDCRISFGTLSKRWDDGGGARIELEIL